MIKTALITGASSGLGVEFAKLHAQNKDNLVLVARSEDKMLQLKNELEGRYGIKVEVIVKDLSISSAAEDVFHEIVRKGIEVDYLINNAGFGGVGMFATRNFADDLSMINVNIVALTALTKLFLPLFIARNSGKILNVSSVAGEFPGPLQAVYFATKAYVTSFSYALYQETKDTDVTVTTLLPGPTNTAFATTARMTQAKLFRKMVSAHSVAKDGFNAMMKGKRRVFSGLSWFQKCSMWLIPFIPTVFVMKQVERLQRTEEEV